MQGGKTADAAGCRVRKRIVILISGRGSNMEAIVRNARDGVLSDCCTVELVLSSSPDAAGLEIARRYGIPTLCLDSKGQPPTAYSSSLADALEPYAPDYIVLAGFMKVLKAPLIDRYKERIINIHPADTALHRGLDGYGWAFESGLTSTKITVHFVDYGVDTGPVIAQAVVDLEGARDRQEVERRGLATEHWFYSEVLKAVLAGGA
ncbi:MAG: phosphoribosylglycinamide formyltransferase [Deltaproteobacteria bacterium]|nr:phosphoribosylglycinamide formyltransferase [Deltaproteobacteria bacterium]